MKEALKPCPHCGCEAGIIIEHGKVFVECSECGCRSAWYSIIFENREKAYANIISMAKYAAEVWNKRV